MRQKPASCLIHEARLTLLCITCDELICEKCSVEGPHNTSGHVLQRLDYAYRSRKQTLQRNLEVALESKSAVLSQKMKNLNFQVEKLRESCQFILKDTKIYFERMADGLKNTFKTDISEFVSRMDYYEAEVREINGLINYFNSFLSPEKGFTFLTVYPTLLTKFGELEDKMHGGCLLTQMTAKSTTRRPST